MLILNPGTSQCKPCEQSAQSLIKRILDAPLNEATPAKKKAPLTKLPSATLVATIQQDRETIKQQTDNIAQLRAQIVASINKAAKPIAPSVADLLTQILENTTLTPFQKLMWEEQVCIG